jgi:hypothetical protein
MKTYRWIFGAWLAAVLSGVALSARAANTDGYVTFSVSTTTNTPKAKYDPKNVAVIWVVNSSGQFIKTVCRHAQGEIQYLSKWIADRGSYTAVDGVTGATLSGPASHVVTWNCRDTNNVVLPDGTYYIRAEYTSYNGQGPYTTNYCGFTKGPVALSTNYPNLKASTGNFTNMFLTFTPIVGDIAVKEVTPTNGLIDYTVAMIVTVTNLTTNATSAFTVSLSNLTTAAHIASKSVFMVAGRASTNVSLTWNTTGLSAGSYGIKATVGPLAGETNTANNVMTNTASLIKAAHDIAVPSLSLSGVVPPRVTTNVTVAVTNAGNIAETFSLSLRDLSAANTIGTRSITNLAAYAATNVVFAWNTTNATVGFHTLQAAVVPVPGEVVTANNTNTRTIIVATGLETNALIARGASWKYLDAGLDISGAGWALPASGYYDGFWAAGAAPLGYGLPQIATAVNLGSDPMNRNTTTYFRREFIADVAPLFATGLVRRVDGLVLYLNGLEIDRLNMPEGSPVGYGVAATNAVGLPGATNYFAFQVLPGNVLIGRNTLAAEVHLSDPTNSALAFDLELTCVNPLVSKTNSVVPLVIQPDGDVQSGDSLGLSVTLTNRGNASVACTVLLRDAATGAILSSQQVPILVAGEAAVVRLVYSTFGLASGVRTLQALTVVNGVTNVAGAVSNTVAVAAPDFAAHAVNAAGSIGGRCNAVAALGQHVYLGCGATLQVWDALNPAAPVLRGTIRLPGVIQHLAAGTGVVYAATGETGIHGVDVSNPMAPVHVFTFDSSGQARRLALSGGLLYLADGLGGVRVLNVTNPVAPALAGAHQTAGPAQALALSAPHLLVLDSDEGLEVLVATNAATMMPTGVCSRVTAGLGLAAEAGMAWVSDAQGGLFQITFTNAGSPSIVTNVTLPAAGNALAVSGPALYVAAGPAGLLAVDAASLAVIATRPAGGEAAAVAVSGTTLYVATGYGGCEAWDVASPFAPSLLGSFGAGLRAVDAEMSGPTLFVAGDEGGFQVHSLTNPAAPVRLTTVPGVTNSRCVAVSGSLAFVADALAGLRIYDIANPDAPAWLGSYPAAGLYTIRRVVVSGARLAMTDGRQINLLDISNPAVPVLLATNVPAGYVFDLAANTGCVFAACGGGGLQVFNSANLGPLGSFSAPPESLVTVAVNGDYAYVGDGRSIWRTLSVTNPAAPFVVQSTAGAVFGAAAAGSLAYLVDGQNRAKAMNVSVPLTPVAGGVFPYLASALRVRAQGGLALSAEDEAGLAILNANPGDIDLDGLSDDWEQQIVVADTNDDIRTIWDVRPGEDFDHDGLSNGAEHVAGTSPVNRLSVFAVESGEQIPGGGFVVTWNSVAGRTYAVHSSTNLANGFFLMRSGIQATVPVNAYTDTVTKASSFYLITVE